MAGNERQTPLVQHEYCDCSKRDHGGQPADWVMLNQDTDEQPHHHDNSAAQDLGHDRTSWLVSGTGGRFSLTDQFYQHDDKASASAHRSAHHSSQSTADWQDNLYLQEERPQMGHNTTSTNEFRRQHTSDALEVIREADAVFGNDAAHYRKNPNHEPQVGPSTIIRPSSSKRTRLGQRRPEGAGLLHKKQKLATRRKNDRDFACPFMKRDMTLWGRCCYFHTPIMSRVKQHIKRAHLREPRDSKVTAEELERLDSQQSSWDQWYWLFDTLFPGYEPKPKSPYYADLSCESFEYFIDSCDDNDILESFSSVSLSSTASDIRQALKNLIEISRMQATANRGDWSSQSRLSTGTEPSTVMSGPATANTTSSAQVLSRPVSSALDGMAATGPSLTDKMPHSSGSILLIDECFPTNYTDLSALCQEPWLWGQDIVQSQLPLPSSVSRSPPTTFSEEFPQYGFAIPELSNLGTSPSTPLYFDEHEKRGGSIYGI